MKFIIYPILLALLLSGCISSEQYENKTGVLDDPAPSLSNNYEGLVRNGRSVGEGYVYQRMKQRCADVGVANYGSIIWTKTNGPYLWATSYKCEIRPVVNPNPIIQPPSIVQPNQQITPTNSKKTIGIDEAKIKCIELGLKSGTESFGKCVLQLLK